VQLQAMIIEEHAVKYPNNSAISANN